MHAVVVVIATPCGCGTLLKVHGAPRNTEPKYILSKIRHPRTLVRLRLNLFKAFNHIVGLDVVEMLERQPALLPGVDRCHGIVELHERR